MRTPLYTFCSGVILYNFSDQEFLVHIGDRIAQLVTFYNIYVTHTNISSRWLLRYRLLQWRRLMRRRRQSEESEGLAQPAFLRKLRLKNWKNSQDIRTHITHFYISFFDTVIRTIIISDIPECRQDIASSLTGDIVCAKMTARFCTPMKSAKA